MNAQKNQSIGKASQTAAHNISPTFNKLIKRIRRLISRSDNIIEQWSLWQLASLSYCHKATVMRTTFDSLLFTIVIFAVAAGYEWYPKSENFRDTDGVLGSFITEFVADSQWQLIVDLDFLKSIFWQPTAQFGKSLAKNDESFIRQLSELVEPLKVSFICKLY